MIPLKDDVPTRSVPIVTWAILAMNVAVFWHELQLGPHAEVLFDGFGLVPARLHDSIGSLSPAGFLPVITSMFIHGGFLHIAGNLLYLHIFGDNVEDCMGHLRFFAFYLFAGAVAGLTHAFLVPGSEVPMVGASGAIAGVTGAYFVNFPTARVTTMIPIFFFFHIVRLPAVFFLLVWFLLQLVSGAAALDGATASSGVAWWAHIGGFLVGAVLGRPLRRYR